MDLERLEGLSRSHPSITGGDWIPYFDSLFREIRKFFVFDNIAIYATVGGNLEATYARAVGRGRSREAEVSWGEELASQVIKDRRLSAVMFPAGESAERIAQPALLGLPLRLAEGPGALLFVRFGGPEFTEEQMPWALLAACQVTHAFEAASIQDVSRQVQLAQKRAQLQDDFIATISHELHTPLGFIKGYTTSLLRSDTTWNTETQREFLTIIDEETDQLVTLIDRMLDSARLQSGTMPIDFQPLRLDALLRDLVIKVQSRHPDLVVSIDFEPVPAILADAVLLEQVINNLFENALKYAPGAGVRIRLRKTSKHQVIDFQDFGPGILPEYLPYLFERFFRVPETRSKRGTGLGLYICQQIINAHQGKISVESIIGQGTTFHIKLPSLSGNAQRTKI